MAIVYLCPISDIFQFFDDVGIVLAGGKINTYLAGTSSQTVTYTDQTGVTPNANPLILGSNGRLNNVQIWQPQSVALKVVITDKNNNQLGPVFDQVTGINDPTITSAAGTFTGTLTGMSGPVNGTISYRIYNNSVFLFFQGGNLTGTSNTAGMTMTGLPPNLRPLQSRAVPTTVIDNNTLYAAAMGLVDATGTITFYKLNGTNYQLSAFTASSIKGLSNDWIFSYPLS